jgi:phosphosulfolactate synthase (CoM biosynthesis protein A)
MLDDYGLNLRELEELSLLSIISLYRKGYPIHIIADAKEVSMEYVVDVIDYCCGTNGVITEEVL